MWLNQLAIHDFSIAFLWISCGFLVDFHSFPVGFPGPFNVDAIAGGRGGARDGDRQILGDFGG